MGLVRSRGRGDAGDSRYSRSRRCRLGLSDAGSVSNADCNARLTVCLSCSAIARDMSSLAAFVTDLAGRVEGAPIWSGTIARDMPLRLSALLTTFKMGTGYVRACHKRNISWPGLDNREHSGLARRICSTWLGVDHLGHQRSLREIHHHNLPEGLEHHGQHPVVSQRSDKSATR